MVNTQFYYSILGLLGQPLTFLFTLIPRVFAPFDQQSGSKWMWKVLIRNPKISDFHTSSCHTHISLSLWCLTSCYCYCFQNQSNQSCNRTLKSCLFRQICPVRSKDSRCKIIITLKVLKQSMAYQSSSSTLEACRQRFVIVLILTISPAETWWKRKIYSQGRHLLDCVCIVFQVCCCHGEETLPQAVLVWTLYNLEILVWFHTFFHKLCLSKLSPPH